MGADGALRDDVIAALERADGITVVRLSISAIEVAKAGQPLRVFPLKPVVSRGLLGEVERYYGIPMAAFYPPALRSKKQVG